jgi:hypothetical protein
MQYTALQNYSVAAGSSGLAAQKAHVMNAFNAIPISSGELMVPENAGVVIQAKSGINAIRVSGTATTTSGIVSNGTTANQIQFYSNDTIVGAFDQRGLYLQSSGIININGTRLWNGLNALSGCIFLGDSITGNLNAGNDNIIIGRSAGANNLSNLNIGIGTFALNVSSGAQNTAIGSYSGSKMTTANYNTLLGADSGKNMVTGANNTCIGLNSGINMNGCDNNTCVGLSTGANILGLGNTAIGSGAMSGSGTTNASTNNVAIGRDAGNNITSGNNNICIGSFSKPLAGGNNNETVIGTNLTGMGSNTTTIGNDTIIFTKTGTNAKMAEIADNGITIIGAGSGDGRALRLGMGNNSQAWSIWNSAANEIHFKNTAYATSAVTINQSALNYYCSQSTTRRVAFTDVGTTPALYMQSGSVSGHGFIYMTGDAAGPIMNFNLSNGIIATLQSNGIWQNGSDIRLKKNIELLNEPILPKLLQIQTKSFHFNYQKDTEPLEIGFIAQEIQEIFPNLVSLQENPDKPNEEKMLGIKTTSFIPYMIKAMQEQHAEIKDMKAQISLLKSMLDDMKK